jgi:hypothetical protein
MKRVELAEATRYYPLLRRHVCSALSPVFVHSAMHAVGLPLFVHSMMNAARLSLCVHAPPAYFDDEPSYFMLHVKPYHFSTQQRRWLLLVAKDCPGPFSLAHHVHQCPLVTLAFHYDPECLSKGGAHISLWSF